MRVLLEHRRVGSFAEVLFKNLECRDVEDVQTLSSKDGGEILGTSGTDPHGISSAAHSDLNVVMINGREILPQVPSAGSRTRIVCIRQVPGQLLGEILVGNTSGSKIVASNKQLLVHPISASIGRMSRGRNEEHGEDDSYDQRGTRCWQCHRELRRLI